MLRAHRCSMFTNACISPSLDPSVRAPGTLYQKKGRVRLLGLLSGSLPQEVTPPLHHLLASPNLGGRPNIYFRPPQTLTPCCGTLPQGANTWGKWLGWGLFL